MIAETSAEQRLRAAISGRHLIPSEQASLTASHGIHFLHARLICDTHHESPKKSLEIAAMTHFDQPSINRQNNFANADPQCSH